MANKPIHVTSEIGNLQRVVLHRPGRELANMKAAEFEKCWIHDAFYLEYAQKESSRAFCAMPVPRCSIWRSCWLRRWM